MELFDTHCHLNDAEAFPSVDAAIAEARAANVVGLVVVGIDVESSKRALEIADEHPGVWATVGWHPNHAHQYSAAALGELAKLAREPKCVAVGEVGLDYHWDFATPEQQAWCLAEQVKLAEVVGKPVVFHCRKAYRVLLALLEASTPGRFVLHCFAGDRDDAARAVALGAWFGVDGPITYPKAQELRDIVCTLPRDRVLIETDSPWMAPVPHRGKPNRPAWVSHVNATLADVWGVTPKEAASTTTANAREFYGV